MCVSTMTGCSYGCAYVYLFVRIRFLDWNVALPFVLKFSPLIQCIQPKILPNVQIGQIVNVNNQIKKKKKTHLVHVLQRKAALGQLNINTVYCQYFKVHN